MSGQRISAFFKEVWSRRQVPGRRRPRVMGILSGRMELLEHRQVLSAVATVPLPAEIGVADTTADQPLESQVPTSTAPVYPDLTGTWDVTLVGTFDGDPIGPFNGSVSITQKKGKLTGIISVPGLPDFILKGRLDGDNVLEFSGKTRFPYEYKPGKFFRIRLGVDLTYAGDAQSFSGTFHRSIFGHDIDGTVTGTRTSP